LRRCSERSDERAYPSLEPKSVNDLFEHLGKVQQEETHKKFPDHIPVKAAKADSGEALARLAYARRDAKGQK
jgi:hypothetical protein